MIRILLFLGTNLAVLLVLSVVTRLLGVDRILTAQGLDLTALAIFSLVFGFTGSFISLWISRWMAKRAYNIQVIETPRNDGERWLVEKVRELSQKANLPMPEVGIYSSSEANAFATGPSKRSSLVAVSTGLLDQMTHREVEGVLAHEVAHIANGDMVTMTLIQGVVNTFVIFFARVVGYIVDSFLSRGRDGGSVGFGYYIVVFVCEMVFGILASLIVAAFSRWREFRADAGAARLDGRDGILDGLKRLETIMARGGVLDERSKALASFKINGSSWAALFSTHPPLAARIEALNRL